MVIKNLENKIKLVLILCSLFLLGCIVISFGSIWAARTMVDDAQKKVYVLDGNVPILVNRSTMEETLDVEAKSHVEMFHHYFFTLAPGKLFRRMLCFREVLWPLSQPWRMRPVLPHEVQLAGCGQQGNRTSASSPFLKGYVPNRQSGGFG